MPVITRRQMATPTYSRQQVADLMKIHPDSVTRHLRAGLASAVLVWGGHSKPMIFSTALTLRWYGAWKCLTPAGRRCHECWGVFEDCQAVGAHLLETRHGTLVACGDEDCVMPSRLGVPCGWIW